MQRRSFVLGLGSTVFVMHAIAQTKAVPRIGLLWFGSGDSANLKEALISGLRKRGFDEGRNFSFVDRTSVKQYEELRKTAKELVEARVDLIVAFGILAPRAAQEATTSIPIVMIGTDPDQRGFVKSLSRPGGNITGVATLTTELAAKRLEILRDCVPFQSLSVLLNPGSEGGVTTLPLVQAQARRLKIALRVFEARKPEEFEAAMQGAAATGSKALYVLPSSLFYTYDQRIAALALKYKLASMGTQLDYVDAGGLIAYAPNLSDLFIRAAGYVARILQGERPADMPMEQPSEFVLALNLKTATALGIKIPEAMRFRATKLVQ